MRPVTLFVDPVNYASASTKASGLNSCKSSIFSPTPVATGVSASVSCGHECAWMRRIVPIIRTGSCRSWAMEKIAPPFDLSQRYNTYKQLFKFNIVEVNCVFHYDPSSLVTTTPVKGATLLNSFAWITKQYEFTEYR